MKTEPDFAELSTEAQERIDEVCDAFERAWRAAVSAAESIGSESGKLSTSGWPAIEFFLKRFSNHERRAALRELVPIDVSYRRRCGATVAVGDYARFTELDPDWLTGIVSNPDGATRRLPAPPAPRAESIPVPALPPTREVFVERLIASGVLDRPTVELALAALSGADASATALGEHLVSRGLLTPFQFDSLLRSHKPGLLLGEYVILSPLGRGGMGAVYRARHRRMDRIVALKVLPSSAAHDPQAASRFDREIRAIARLSHPNIVVAHDAGEDAGIAYLVMECIEGTDLATCVRTHGPLSVAHAVECIVQAAEGLEYAHQQGVIHRDIKPSNLVLCHDRNGLAADGNSKTDAPHDAPPPANWPHSVPPTALRVKVLDLGLARFKAESTPTTTREGVTLTGSGVMFGTPEYMSPEQAVSASTADARSDIYSLGCTLYFLLTGRTVVSGKSFLETVMAHQIQPLPSLSASRGDVPAELEQIYRRLTARKAEHRFRSMQEVRDALRAILADRLPRAAGRVNETNNLKTTPARQTAVGGNPATDWLAPLGPADQGKTVLFADLDTPTDTRRPLSAGARFVEWVKRNSAAVLALSVVLGGLLIAGAVWWNWPPDNRMSGAGQPVIERPPVAKKATPGSLRCPANETVVQSHQREWAEYLGQTPSYQNSIGLTLCLIPPGEFTMGTTDAEFEAISGMGLPHYEIARIRDEMPARHVRLTKPFWIGQTEVTVGQFRKFADAENYVTETEKTAGYGFVNRQWVLKPGYSWKDVGEEIKITDQHPASNITWNDAVAFCEWLSRYESKETGRPARYRLPTEAEWEFACRAGTDSPWYFGSDPRASRGHAIFSGNAEQQLHPVGTKQANPFRLFDIAGNQSEWCHDWFAPYGSETTDPTGPLNGQQRVQRGGNFASQPLRLRSASRERNLPTSPQNGSLRVVREP